MASSPIHKSPALIACAAFIGGILLQTHHAFSSGHILLFSGISAGIILLLQLIPTRRFSFANTLHLFFIVISFVTLGALRLQLKSHPPEFNQVLSAQYTATVNAVPQEKPKSYLVKLIIDSVNTNATTYLLKQEVLAYVEKSPEVTSLLPGQRISFRGVLKPPTKALNPNDFDYKNYLARQEIYATTYIKTDDWQQLEGVHYTLRIRAARIQHSIVKLFESLDYEDDELALISALTVGYKQKIEPDQRQAFIASGATHILAVSGLHVGIIFVFLTRFFKLIRANSKHLTWIRIGAIILLLWGFAFITGLTPSVCRATIMFSLVSIGTLSRQQNCIFNVIFLSAFLLLIVNPFSIYDVGFQLSYLAVLGILAFQPYFSAFFTNKAQLPKSLSDLMSVSVAAQLGTAPIGIHTFNCFPLYFMLTNIWIIPLVGLVIQLAIVLIICSFIGLPIAWLAVLLEWSLKLMNFGVYFISQLKNALLDYLFIDNLTVLLMYAMLIVIVLALHFHSKKYLRIAIYLGFVVLSANFSTLNNQTKQQSFYIFHGREGLNLGIQQGLKGYMVIDNPHDQIEMPTYFIQHYLAKSSLNLNFWTKNVRDDNLVKHRDFLLMPKHICAVYGDDISKYTGTIHVNTLVINNIEPIDIYQLYKHFTFDTLVLYKRPKKSINYYKNFCDKSNIKLHLIYEEGAFIAKL